MIMKTFDSFFQKALKDRISKNIYRDLQPVVPGSGMIMECNGKHFINFSSNDYLGLSQNPLLKIQSQQWIEQYGNSSTASRLITGNYSFYPEIEKSLADFLGTEAALIFDSGWQANVAILACLIEQLPKPVLVFTDRLNHASLHYGCKAGQVRQIRYRHCDMNHLSECLKRYAEVQGSRMIVTETIFSMDGDRSDLEVLRELANQWQCFLYLDDAHASGVFGRYGKGLAPAYADLTLGTFSKGWGSFGAYVAGSRALCQWLINYCSGFIHTTALPPSVIGCIAKALELMPQLDKARQFVLEQSDYVRNKMQEWSIDVGGSNTQIIPVIVKDANKAIQAAKLLADDGIWVMPIRPPTVSPNQSRLRLTISAAHSKENIDQMLNSFYKIRGLIQDS